MPPTLGTARQPRAGKGAKTFQFRIFCKDVVVDLEPEKFHRDGNVTCKDAPLGALHVCSHRASQGLRSAQTEAPFSLARGWFRESRAKENPAMSDANNDMKQKMENRSNPIPAPPAAVVPLSKERHPVAWTIGGAVAFVAVLWMWGVLEGMVGVQQGMSLWDYSQKRNSMNFISRSGMEFYLEHFTDKETRLDELRNFFPF